ncbi:MAG: DNA polymerase III subunit delta [Magnetospirillum sp.]|nr:DNA polymerase III subunit delta [Magnetospirillum sp.]
MKIAGARVAAFLKSPDAAARAILVYGPDAGLVRERVTQLMRTAVADLKDPFRVAELAADTVRGDPARLADEAAAMALTGGRRAVVVRDAGDGITQAVGSFLAAAKGDAMVVLEGGDLGARSSLRKLVEGADNAATLACYGDEGGSLAAIIQEELKGAGLTAEPDALAFLVGHLGADRRVTRADLGKLAHYMGGQGRVRLEDAVACIGDAAALSMDDLAMAAADGDHATAQRVLDRLLAEGTHPVAVLRALSRHFLRLHLAAGLVGQGRSVEQAVGALKPPPIFKVADRVKRQLGRWSADTLGRAVELLLHAEADCKTTGMPNPEICSRALMQLARAAGRR